MLVLSPHLDDAVLSCGRLIGAQPDCRVLTVFAGTPGDGAVLTGWDARCGFPDAAGAMRARRRENARAMAVLDARAVDLGELDAQYRRARDPADTLPGLLAPWLAREAGGMVVAPLGLFHEDHVLLADAVLHALSAACSSPLLLLYEDQPYRKHTDRVAQRLDELRARGLALAPYRPARLAPAWLKQYAMAAYRSQLAGLGLAAEAWRALADEHYWAVGRQAAGMPLAGSGHRP